MASYMWCCDPLAYTIDPLSSLAYFRVSQDYSTSHKGSISIPKCYEKKIKPLRRHRLSYPDENREGQGYVNKSWRKVLISWITLQKKPYSAVTVAVDRLTSEQYEEDEYSGIPDLVEVIKLQATGPAEAARAIRKKLKYGNVHRQLRALTILDGLIQNAGSRFQRAFLDEPLLERLRVCGTSDLADPQVRDKCKVLYAGWAREYKSTPGLERIAGLYKVWLPS